MRWATLFYYILVSIVVVTVDRITKLYALSKWCDEYVVHECLSFQVLFNKGISWGLLNADYTFTPITLVIILVTIVLAVYAYKRLRQGYSIWGELLVCVGSFSNILDRLLYGGVIDFILIHKGPWTWPVFNIADVAIVTGVTIMFIQLIYTHEL